MWPSNGRKQAEFWHLHSALFCAIIPNVNVKKVPDVKIAIWAVTLIVALSWDATCVIGQFIKFVPC